MAATYRTGCKVMIRLHCTSDHGWVISRFERQHNHPAVFRAMHEVLSASSVYSPMFVCSLLSTPTEGWCLLGIGSHPSRCCAEEDDMPAGARHAEGQHLLPLRRSSRPRSDPRAWTRCSSPPTAMSSSVLVNLDVKELPMKNIMDRWMKNECELDEAHDGKKSTDISGASADNLKKGLPLSRVL